MSEAPKRGWFPFAFTLRTLFVAVTVLAVPMAWAGYKLDWIRKRHEMLTNHPWIHFSTGFDLDVTAPGLLWIFGEEGNRGFCMMFFDATPNRSATLNSVEEQIVQDAKRIFPEAHISGVVLPFKLPPTSSTESNDNE